VADVHEFADHIACDSASRSELVVPLFQGETILGVLDLDSPSLGRFDAEEAGIVNLAKIYVASLGPADFMPSALPAESDLR
jgi:L-methionine (R)-S-oxide reductase